jgi:hypothetical protein
VNVHDVCTFIIFPVSICTPKEQRILAVEGSIMQSYINESKWQCLAGVQAVADAVKQPKKNVPEKPQDQPVHKV